MLTPDLQLEQLVEEKNEQVVRSSAWFGHLKAAINFLIVNDFAALVHLLYKADVPEKKLKNLLAQNAHTDAAAIIAELVLERQLQKIASRKSFGAGTADIPDEERW